MLRQTSYHWKKHIITWIIHTKEVILWQITKPT